MILDNWTAYVDTGVLKAINLCFLPLCATSIIQPMDEK